MSDDRLETEVRSVLCTLLGLAPEAVALDAARSDVEAWDSLRHMNLVMAIEERYGIAFDDDEVAGLDSIPKLVAAIAEKRP